MTLREVVLRGTLLRGLVRSVMTWIGGLKRAGADRFRGRRGTRGPMRYSGDAPCGRRSSNCTGAERYPRVPPLGSLRGTECQVVMKDTHRARGGAYGRMTM
ncbi:hypothetical protein GCM10010365_11860 [Streptomyces poonensis]|uniref:Uncharacterized protein n=1 Tax=Streptomyces poonensis TaxID=68255 RepID=A0A918PAH2_9ACTN|nr:hypothetical protein GCM10010365_11860 [Streptomyces poonensis]GLJ88717.1 hypothetical protein GCM10017589_13170 [Streptomyces poonensis]